MERHNAELIIKYYYAIPAMKRLLAEERRDLEEECFGCAGLPWTVCRILLPPAGRLKLLLSPTKKAGRQRGAKK